MSISLMPAQQQELVNEVNMLRDYTKALEAENTTRNQQRKILEKQIERLTNLQRLGQSKTTTVSISQPCTDCPKLKSQIMRLQNHIQRLQRENANLQSSYNAVSESLTRLNSTETSTTRTTIIRSGSSSALTVSDDLQKKYKELSEKYDSINYQNMELKKDLQRYSKMNIPGLQQKIRTSQKQNISLHAKIASLQSQVNNLKASIEAKVNEILLSRSTSSTTSQYEINSLKETLMIKDKQIVSLREKASTLTTIQFQLRNTKMSLASKQAQITKLREQISKNQQQSSKIYQLQAQIRSLKYTITSKDTQIQTLKNKTTEISSSQENKRSSIQLQIKNLKTVLAGKDTEISSLKSQNNELLILRARITSLENQINTWKIKYNEQSNRIKVAETTNISNTISHYNEQITTLNTQITRLSEENRDKDLYIVRIEDQLKQLRRRDEEKNKEVRKLDGIVNAYMAKIGELQIQINRLEKSSLNGSQNHIMTAQIFSLTEENKTLNEKIYDLEHRIMVLEQANMGLRQQLRLSIEMRSKQASRIVMNPSPPPSFQEQFLNTIKMLTVESQRLKEMNSQLKSDNEYLQARISSFELQVENLATINRNMGTIASLSTKNIPNIPNHRAPIYPAMVPKQQRVQREISSSKLNSRSRLKQKAQRHERNKIVQVVNSSNKIHIRDGHSHGQKIRSGTFDDLQRKIEMLKSENKELRKHLYTDD